MGNCYKATIVALKSKNSKFTLGPRHTLTKKYEKSAFCKDIKPVKVYRKLTY